MTRFTNLDDAQTIFFQRELESVKSRSYDVLKAPLRAFSLIPVASEAGEGAESIVYQQYDMTGIAKIIANYASAGTAAEGMFGFVSQPCRPWAASP